MSQPSSRRELKEYCLRRLGFPVIDINIDDDQINDRIDDVLQLYSQYHFDGSEYTWLGQQITQTMIDQRSITLSDNIIAVNKVLPISQQHASSTSSAGFNIFDINYQLRLNDFYNLTSSSYTYYVIAREHLAMLDMIITGDVFFTYNKTTNVINIAMDWAKKVNAGDYLLFEARRIIDPDLYYKVFNDPWVKEYATQIIKKQWGSNLTKYDNYVLPGGIVVNGAKIYADADAEIARLEQKLRDTYEEPPQFIVG